MNRRFLQVRSIAAHERIAQPALDAGYCKTRAQVRACHALSRLGGRGLGAFRDQQARRAAATLPPEGPGAIAYYRAVTWPSVERRYALHVKRHGVPAYGTHLD